MNGYDNAFVGAVNRHVANPYSTPMNGRPKTFYLQAKTAPILAAIVILGFCDTFKVFKAI
jgi:hypothetical protein